MKVVVRTMQDVGWSDEYAVITEWDGLAFGPEVMATCKTFPKVEVVSMYVKYQAVDADETLIVYCKRRDEGGTL